MSDPQEKYRTTQHYIFYSLIVSFTGLGIIFQIRVIQVIFNNRSFRKLSAYQILAFAAFMQGLNCVCQLVAAALSFHNPSKLYWTNKVIGAFFHGTWTAEYPTILVLAMNRFVAVMFPGYYTSLFSPTIIAIFAIVCVIYGILNTILCLTSYVHNNWDPYIHLFIFNEDTIAVKITVFIDSYLVLILVCFASFLYIITFVNLIIKVRANGIRSIRNELSVFINFAGIFLPTGVLLYFYHFPLYNFDYFLQYLNLLIVYRYSINNTLILMSNKSFRTAYFAVFKQKKTSVVSIVESTSRVRKR